MDIGARRAAGPGREVGFKDSRACAHARHPEHDPRRAEHAPQLAQSPIGQFDVRVTPLQMAMVAAGVANDAVMKPYLVQSVIGSDLSVIETTDPQELSQAVTPDVAAQLDPG